MKAVFVLHFSELSSKICGLKMGVVNFVQNAVKSTAKFALILYSNFWIFML